MTGTEAGDEESCYEVEVTLDDGTEVDVQLDKETSKSSAPKLTLPTLKPSRTKPTEPGCRPGAATGGGRAVTSAGS